MKRILIALVFLLVLPFAVPFTSCEAAQWEKVASVKEGDLIINGYIDKDSVRIVPTFFVQNKRELWEKRTFSPYKVLYNRPVAEMLQYMHYQDSKQYCILETWITYTDGTKLNNKYACQLTRIVPDSIEESVWKYVFSLPVPNSSRNPDNQQQ